MEMERSQRKRRLPTALFLLPLLLLPLRLGSGSGRDAINQRNYGNPPLSFELNQGQASGPIKFLSRGNGYSLFLTPTEAVVALGQGALPARRNLHCLDPVLQQNRSRIRCGRRG
jgi:hypothetical protein